MYCTDEKRLQKIKSKVFYFLLPGPFSLPRGGGVKKTLYL